MTVLSPPVYEIKVEELDEFGRVSRIEGRCNWKDATGYMVALAVINLLILVMAGWESYKARNLSTEFSESQYLFRALVSTLSVSFMGIPLVLLTEGNPNALAFVSATIIFVSSTSILLFIFLPKMKHLRQLRAGGGVSRSRPTGKAMGVEKGPRWKVSGLESGPSGIHHNGIPISDSGKSPLPRRVANGVRSSTMIGNDSSSDLQGMKVLTMKSKSELLQENEILEGTLEELKQLIEDSESMETLRAALVLATSVIPSHSDEEGWTPMATISEPNGDREDIQGERQSYL